MFGLGTTEIIVIVVVLFLLFGATRLPQLAKSLGQSRKAFRDGMREAEEEYQKEEEQRRLKTPDEPKPVLNGMSDEQLFDEMRRRQAQKESQT